MLYSVLDNIERKKVDEKETNGDILDSCARGTASQCFKSKKGNEIHAYCLNALKQTQIPRKRELELMLL